VPWVLGIGWRMKEQGKWRGAGTAGWRLRADGRVHGEGIVGVLIRSVQGPTWPET
jgi:hypothetical protein